MSKVVFVQLLDAVSAVSKPTAVEHIPQNPGLPQTFYGLLKAANDNHLVWPLIPPRLVRRVRATNRAGSASVMLFQVVPRPTLRCCGLNRDRSWRLLI